MSELVVRAVRPDEYEPMARLASQVFARGDAKLERRILRRWHNRRDGKAPDFDYRLHRVGLVDGEVVAHVRLVPRVLRYGQARLRVMGISAVCTAPAYRRRGYAATVLQDALLVIAEQQAHLSLLNGIPNYYNRFGFHPVWPHFYVEIPAADAALLESSLTVRPGQPEDIPHLMALYEEHWGGRVSLVRPQAMWAWQVWDGTREYFRVVEDAHGQIVGYIAAFDPTHVMAEVVADTPDAARALLVEAGRAFLVAGMATIQWLMPPDDAFVMFARSWVGVTVKAGYHPTGGWQGRVMDGRALVEAVLPELVEQAEAAHPDFNPAALWVEANGTGVAIGLHGQKATLCQLSYPDFTQLLFGSLRPDALRRYVENPLPFEAVRLLEWLFPPRLACLAAWDWF
ncbi:MAG: GNAT family N-acetyltransferase [Anaerolineaceae bacterium]|nr:GNAT family N-acetyltransferase [Anaerolineaceae bacterium]